MSVLPAIALSLTMLSTAWLHEAPIGSPSSKLSRRTQDHVEAAMNTSQLRLEDAAVIVASARTAREA